jgi:hypothetical protein
MSRYPEITNGSICLWNYFGSGPSKGPHDSVGAVVKHFIQHAQLDQDGPELKNAEQVVEFLRTNLISRPKTSYIGHKQEVS